MKRRQRKPILDINGEQAESTRARWHNKYEQIVDEHGDENDLTKNPLINLVGHYDSDSETDDKKMSSNKLNDKVDDFLKEIQAIKPEKSSDQQRNQNKNHNYDKHQKSTDKWQECYDETTGYPYYWHMETNEVTWEIPEELRAKRNTTQNETAHTQFMGQMQQWPMTSAKNYPHMQANIPDGMIPKEVVARNRNRQIESQSKPPSTQQQLAATTKKSWSKDDDSDDGKIEMITSFGNDNSESEESFDESSNKSSNQTKSKDSTTKLKRKKVSPTRKETSGKMGPTLPENMIPMVHGPENRNSSDRRSKNSRSDHRLNERVPSGDLEKSVSTKSDSTTDSSNSRTNKPPREVKVSLVPGYEDDSDNEEESQKVADETKPLFPISNYYNKDGSEQNANKVSTSCQVICDEKTVKKVETRQTDSGCIRIFEYHESGDAEKDDQGEDALKSETEEVKTDPELKPNKFFDDIDAPSKAFQRKKRIAFDVNPSKPKAEPTENTELVSSYTTPYENEEKYGFGFQDKTTDDSAKVSKDASVGKPGISFVKGETINAPKEEAPKVSVMSQAQKAEFKVLTDTTLEKLKFLSEGSPEASAVQVMAIQLQTLLSAWESKNLNEKYLSDWLTETSRELGRLEQTAAPPGWECQWDRSHKRYFYRNMSNGEVQWTYPETDVVGGTEEMELCTTPPPEQEEPSVIEVRNAPSLEQSESQDKNDPVDSESMLAPPPPQISSPSPPPPPRINAEDLKRGKKRKEDQEIANENSKKEKLDKVTEEALKVEAAVKKSTDVKPQSSKPSSLAVSEPLPPGVDSPDLSYSLSASAMDSTVLYTAAAQQTNPIYAATLGSAAVPLLAHHTALMQGQLMHYPAYHPLHNQMLMATANRIAEQDTIQFMVTDYARIYENSQVIAKPPVKTTVRESIHSAIDSFYNDIASIEQNTKIENEANKKVSAETVPSTTVQVQQTESEQSPASVDPNLKEKKKKKTKIGIGKKQKEVSNMVAKWQKVQQNLSD